MWFKYAMSNHVAYHFENILYVDCTALPRYKLVGTFTVYELELFKANKM